MKPTTFPAASFLKNSFIYANFKRLFGVFFLFSHGLAKSKSCGILYISLDKTRYKAIFLFERRTLINAKKENTA